MRDVDGDNEEGKDKSGEEQEGEKARKTRGGVEEEKKRKKLLAIEMIRKTILCLLSCQDNPSYLEKSYYIVMNFTDCNIWM